MTCMILHCSFVTREHKSLSWRTWSHTLTKSYRVLWRSKFAVSAGTGRVPPSYDTRSLWIMYAH